MHTVLTLDVAPYGVWRRSERLWDARLTPDSVWSHIQGKNRMRYVASRIMWRLAENPNGIRTSVDLSAT